MPGLAKQAEDQVIEEVDPELKPEEQGYVRHYLGYADVMLKKAEADAAEQAKNGQDQSPAEAPAAAEQKSGENASSENSNVTPMPRQGDDDNGSQAA